MSFAGLDKLRPVSFGKGSPAILHGSEPILPVGDWLEVTHLRSRKREYIHNHASACAYCASQVTGPRCESCGAPAQAQRQRVYHSPRLTFEQRDGIRKQWERSALPRRCRGPWLAPLAFGVTLVGAVMALGVLLGWL